MAENSDIEWTDHTFNPWIGCTKVSAACDHCYAEAIDSRFHPKADRWTPGASRQRTSEATWRNPIIWDRRAARDGVRRKVFCASMADVFDSKVSREWHDDLWRLITVTRNLDWLLLTKRPQNIKRLLPSDWSIDRYPHVWLGTTVETQEEAERRIPHLLGVQADVRFLSCEPLLGPVNLRKVITRTSWGGYQCDALVGLHFKEFNQPILGPKIDWVIAGGESGPAARPTHPDHFRSLRDQCSSAGVPFFFKQHGEWRPVSVYDDDEGITVWGDHTRTLQSGDEWVNPNKCAVLDPGGGRWENDIAQPCPDAWVMERVGKKSAGRLLDGVLHDAYPEVS